MDAAEYSFRQGRLLEAERAVRAALEGGGEAGRAYLLLACISGEFGRHAEALAYARKATVANPLSARAHAQYAFAALAIGNEALGTEAATRALALGPRDVETLDLIGVCFHGINQFDRAVAAFQTAVALDPVNSSLLANLGAAQSFVGDLGGAEASYRAAITANAANAAAYAGLSEVRTASAGDNNIGQLADLFARTRDPAQSIRLCHALAREQEQLGNPMEALETLRRGKQMVARVVLRRGPPAEVMLADLCATLTIPASAVGFSGAQPIFVVGLPRTGTTVVERILSNCPGGLPVQESPVFARLTRALIGSASPAIVDPPLLRQRLASIDVAALGQDYAAHVAAATAASGRSIDKLPLNLLLADVIVRALPNARIVCLSRGALDTIIGNYSQPFELATGSYHYTLSLEDTAAFYVAAMRWAALLAKRHPGNIRIVQYERLIADPLVEAHKIVDFCGLPWDAACIAIDRNTAPVATASAIQVRSPITDRHIGRWRRFDAGLGAAKAVLDRHGVPHEAIAQ